MGLKLKSLIHFVWGEMGMSASGVPYKILGLSYILYGPLKLFASGPICGVEPLIITGNYT